MIEKEIIDKIDSLANDSLTMRDKFPTDSLEWQNQEGRRAGLRTAHNLLTYRINI